MKKVWLGLQEYNEVQALQKSKVVEYVGQSKIDIYGLEFDSTLTLGIRSAKKQSSDVCEHHNFKTIQTDRGGRTTIHSRGQLVIFPMLDLKSYNLGSQKFIQILFESTQLFLKMHDIACQWQLKDAGVYTNNGKIAFCGLRVDSGVVRHGISININNDLSLFKSFVACGNANLKADSLVAYLNKSPKNVDLQVHFDQWFDCFDRIWQQHVEYKQPDKNEDFFLNR